LILKVIEVLFLFEVGKIISTPEALFVRTTSANPLESSRDVPVRVTEPTLVEDVETAVREGELAALL
jgi:hypothetical protein